MSRFNSLSNKEFYLKNVNNMIVSNKLKTNDIVCTLGYFSEGDGGAATYLIKNTSEVSDGGSVITLNSGLQAHLQPNGFVNYSQFGAKLDGDSSRVTQETAAIQKCHAYANKNDLPVKQAKGTIILNATVTVQTSTDLSGCTLPIGSYAQGKTLYLITSKKTPVVVATVTQSELTKGVNRIPSLSNYKHHLITITSSELLSIRHDGGSTANMYKKDSAFLTRDGAFVSGKLIQDFTTGTLTVTARPFEEKKLVFEGAKIVWDFKNVSNTCTVVKAQRGNISLCNMMLDIPNTIDYDDSLGGSFKGSAFYVQDAYKVELKNIVAENITEGSNASGYILQMDNVIDVTFDNLQWLNGWGATGTNNVKDWKIFNSQINRIDAHTGSGDLYCNNVKFIGGWGVFLGYGDGRIILENCESDFVNIDGRENDSVVYLGSTYGVVFEGEIIVTNHKIKSRSARNRHIFRCPFSSSSFDYQNAYDIQLPSLTVRDVTFEGTGSEMLYGYLVSNIDYLATTLTNNNKLFGHPKVIDIQGVRMNIDSDTSYFQAVEFSVGSSVGAKSKDGGTKIILKDIPQSVHSYFKSGFTTAQLQAEKQPKKLIRFINMTSDPTKVKHSLNVNNCGGSLHFEAKSTFVKLSDSELSGIDIEGQATHSPDRFIVKGCDWYPVASSALDKSIIGNANLEANNNTFYTLKKDGSVLPFGEFNYVGGAKRLTHNLFAYTSADATLTDKYWKYVNATFYKSPTSL